MLGLFRRSDEISRKFARKISRYEVRCRISCRGDKKQLNKLLKSARYHVKLCLPKDSPYREIDIDSMYKLRVTAFYHLEDDERKSIGIEDYCINAGDVYADHDIHEVWVRIPVKNSKLFVAFNFKYKVKRV